MDYPRENWRVVATHPTYEVSDHGRVRNIDRQHILSVKNGRRGGTRVLLYKHGTQTPYQVNRLVAMMFMDGFNPRLAVLCYDEDKQNNHIDNLYQHRDYTLSRFRNEL